MLNLKLPDQYDTGMSIRETEVAIKLLKIFLNGNYLRRLP